MRERRIVVASQPRYLPSCGYLHRMLLADVFVYLDTVQYTPRDWENRNRVKSSGGPLWLTVPVVHTHRGQRILETVIDNSQDWTRKHLRALELNYRRAPHFDEVLPVLSRILERRWELLWELNVTLVDALLGFLGERVHWVRASELGPETATGQEFLIALCRRAGGDTYLSGPLGRNYIDAARFRAEGLGLAFHDYRPAPYAQLYGPFVPNLSAVDLLFNCGRASLAVLRTGNVTRADLARAALEPV